MMKTLKTVLGYSSLAISLAAGGILYGCSTTKEVDYVPAPAPVVQMTPPPVVVSAPPAMVVAPPDASQTTTTSWGNGVVEQNKTKTIDGTSQRQTTTTWNNGYPGSQSTSTTTTTTGQ